MPRRFITAESRQHSKVARLDELEARMVMVGAGAKFGAGIKHLGSATGSRGIGYTWYDVEPGKAHFYCANEESLFMLAFEPSKVGYYDGAETD